MARGFECFEVQNLNSRCSSLLDPLQRSGYIRSSGFVAIFCFSSFVLFLIGWRTHNDQIVSISNVNHHTKLLDDVSGKQIAGRR